MARPQKVIKDRILLVLANRVEDYMKVVKRCTLPPNKVKWVKREEDLRGVEHGTEIVKIGEWWLNPASRSPFLQFLKEVEWE